MLKNITVTEGTYIAFIVLMFFGAALALTLCNANDIIRQDGTRVILMKNPTWQSELLGLYETLKLEPFVLLLFPMFFSSNWFYTYQFNAVNGSYFNTRTKALNSLLYWLAQIAAAGIWGSLLDIKRVSRTVRARCALIVLFVLTFVIWGGGYAHQKTYTRESVDNKGADWTKSGYFGPLFLFIFYGFYDAAWQATVYWYVYSGLKSTRVFNVWILTLVIRFIGALSNSGRRTANYVGFYKGIQSAGAAISWNLDARGLSFKSQFISNWVLLSASLVMAAPVIFLKIRDHIDIDDDLKGTDETYEDVLPPGHHFLSTVHQYDASSHQYKAVDTGSYGYAELGPSR